MDSSIETLTREITFTSTKVDQLNHELAQYKRLRFGKSSEKLDRRRPAFWKRRLTPTCPPSKKS
ncbi:transposase domain-containing protein [Variovorax paradoxus]|uniref:transposase domain-containing protein n=1 Tax=Variovorax paradoxus TaxID=34073 RepID=UPI003D64D572